MTDCTSYDILGVEPQATSEELKIAYRRLIGAVHPDRGGTTALFLQVQNAYQTLADPVRRASYDASIAHANVGGGSETPGESQWGWVGVDVDGRRRTGARSGGPGGQAGGIQSFLSRHPSAVVAACGLVLLWLGGAGGGLIGILAILVGGIGLIGDRRGRTVRTYAGPEPSLDTVIARLGSELRAGAPVVAGFFVALCAGLFGLGHRHRPRGRRR
ncbi:MAG: J domain-containing protein [Acidimicrobiales bacterium]